MKNGREVTKGHLNIYLENQKVLWEKKGLKNKFFLLFKNCDIQYLKKKNSSEGLFFVLGA